MHLDSLSAQRFDVLRLKNFNLKLEIFDWFAIRVFIIRLILFNLFQENAV